LIPEVLYEDHNRRIENIRRRLFLKPAGDHTVFIGDDFLDNWLYISESDLLLRL
jgi:hypothetical protein